MRLKLNDLPPHLRAQAERQLAPRDSGPPTVRRESPPAQTSGNLAPYRSGASREPPFRKAGKGMNKTEAAYQREILHGRGRYEPITFRLLGGCRYTPDFLTIDDGVPTFHEVKGSYRLGSEGRAWTAFCSAAAQYPFFRWVWAVQDKAGWSVKRRAEPGQV